MLYLVYIDQTKVTPEIQIVSPLESITLKCNHTKIVKWIFITPIMKIIMIAANNSLKINAIDYTDEGQYECIEYYPKLSISLATSLVLIRSKCIDEVHNMQWTNYLSLEFS